MKSEMTSRERMMTALRGGVPDRVPCCPDISNMVPCRLTGKPFWEIYLNANPPLWRAYLDAVRYYGMDGWFMEGCIQYKTAYIPETETRDYIKDGRHVRRFVAHTPYGDLEQEYTCFEADSPTFTEKYIKDFKEDFKKFKYLFPDIVGYDDSCFQMQKKELGEDGIMGVGVFPPGFQIFLNYFHGNLEAVTYAYYDEPELFGELTELFDRQAMQQMEMIAEVRPDSILTGGSGSITLQSEELWRELSLPTIKKLTAMSRQAGIISGIHSCGKEEYLVRVCAEETDLNYVNPLEIPPMGDCNLKEIKQKYGKKLALMGNLHTTNVMLCGSRETVREASIRALKDAAEGGGFALSTGDQCGRDTPDENIREMVRVCKEFGVYAEDGTLKNLK